MKIKYKNGIKIEYTFPEEINVEQIGDIIIILRNLMSIDNNFKRLNEIPKIVKEYGSPIGINKNILEWCKTKEKTINFINKWNNLNEEEKLDYIESINSTRNLLTKKICYYKKKYGIK